MFSIHIWRVVIEQIQFEINKYFQGHGRELHLIYIHRETP